jgi:hypothetical protein
MNHKPPIQPNLSINYDINYAKQTQFPKGQNGRKHLLYKGLSNFYPAGGAKKQTQTNPISPTPKTPHLLTKKIPFYPPRPTNNPPRPPALAVGFSGLIYINSAGCPFYHFNGLWHLIQLWDLEYFATLTAVYPSVSGTAIKQPSTATFGALGDNLHQYIPYTNSQILKKEHLLELTETQNILPTDSIVIHQKFPSCPIISPEHKLLRFRHKKPGSVVESARFSLIYMLKSAKIVGVGGRNEKKNFMQSY